MSELIEDVIAISKSSFEAGYYSREKGKPLKEALDEFLEKAKPKGALTFP